mmetsp:Transcript_9799/g.27368  ORF Transcript_9799/g.27368 Transcript_9799/m.27368 type:complete len:340 (-) Transcript_9799:363-1382(-)
MRSTMGPENKRISSVPRPICRRDRSLICLCCSSGSKSARSSGTSSSSSSSSSSSCDALSESAAIYVLESAMVLLPLAFVWSPLLTGGSNAKDIKHATNSSKLMDPLLSTSAASNILLCDSFDKFSWRSLQIMQNSLKSIWLSPLTSYKAKKGARIRHILRTSSTVRVFNNNSLRFSDPIVQSVAQLCSRNCAIAPRSVNVPSFSETTVVVAIFSCTALHGNWLSRHILYKYPQKKIMQRQKPPKANHLSKDASCSCWRLVFIAPDWSSTIIAGICMIKYEKLVTTMITELSFTALPNPTPVLNRSLLPGGCSLSQSSVASAGRLYVSDVPSSARLTRPA